MTPPGSRPYPDTLIDYATRSVSERRVPPLPTPDFALGDDDDDDDDYPVSFHHLRSASCPAAP